MKFANILIFLFFSVALICQRGDVPKENPENSLDLKVVFQEYTITTTSDHVVTRIEENEFLSLKVNNMYLPNGNTGISKSHFDRYLGNCPKALDLSLEGLDRYSESKQKLRMSNLSRLAGLLGGIYFGARAFGQEDNTSGYIALGAFAAGFSASYIFKDKARSIEIDADNMIVSAFDLYANECYRADFSMDIDKVEDVLDNGDVNNDEKILIDIRSNNISSPLYTVGALLGFSFFEASTYNYGPELSYYNKGFHLNAKGYLSGAIDASLPDNPETQYGGSIVGSIPIFGGVKTSTKSFLSLGRYKGMDAYATSDEIPFDYYRALSVDLGADYHQQYGSNFELVNDYFVESVTLRTGLSFSLLSESSYTVDDNRFSEKVRYSLFQARFYANLLYNYDTDYEILSDKFFHDDPFLDDELGLVLGFDIKFGRSLKHGGVTTSLEVGKYPMFNQANGWGGQFKIGYALYSLKRS